MKKLLSVIVFLTFAISVFSQDIIVKKDGSTIQAKVEKVTSTEVEYKKASNPDGPTYTVSIADLISINYQNGSSDVFTPNTTKLNSTTNNGYVTDETASRYSQDQRILRQYKVEQYETYAKKAKTWKMSGLIGGSALIVTGAILMFGNNDGIELDKGVTHPSVIGLGLVGLGVVGGGTCYIIGNNYSKQASASRSLIGLDCNFDDGRSVNLSLNAMGTYYNPGIGVGVCYNF